MNGCNDIEQLPDNCMIYSKTLARTGNLLIVDPAGVQIGWIDVGQEIINLTNEG